MNNDKYRQGVIAAKSGDLETACKIFTTVIQDDPSSEKGWVALGRCLADPVRKVYCFERTLALNPKNETAQRWLDEFKKAENSDEEAANMAEIRAEEQPPAENFAKSPKRSSCVVWAITSGCILGIIFFGWILYLFAVPNKLPASNGFCGFNF